HLPTLLFRPTVNKTNISCKRAYYSNDHVDLGHPCHSFPLTKDVCYFAHCYPYTYTKLWSHLAELERDPRCLHFCEVRTLCRSLAGNLVPVVTVSNPSRDGGSSLKPAVVLSARVHPQERLRDAFVFKLRPMVSPVGVRVGNHRCLLTGRDLNQIDRSKLQDSFPSVWATRRLVQRSNFTALKQKWLCFLYSLEYFQKRLHICDCDECYMIHRRVYAIVYGVADAVLYQQ
uniref:Uncharacterized protein n=1 Tax=Electrophorus electricus TaxID=8005 RepID=A0A4W4E9N6_ELEEL